MKVLTLNFLSCAVKACKAAREAFPLHPKDAVLEQSAVEQRPRFLRNILPRIDWDALVVTSAELGFPSLPAVPPSPETLETDEAMLKELHVLLLETQIVEGKLVCGNCGYEYSIKEGIANFLLPNHLV